VYLYGAALFEAGLRAWRDAPFKRALSKDWAALYCKTGGSSTRPDETAAGGASSNQMDDITKRLTFCFHSVFPDLPEASLAAASLSTVGEWDSVAAITLMNVLEEEFGLQLDFDRISEWDSFSSIREFLLKELRAA
jgi:acyl carrier protein